jgi:hypothetical protein
VVVLRTMTKQYILHEIKRTAHANGGVPLGRDRFVKETSIRYHDCFGIFWSRWSEAIAAGLTPNKLRAAYPEQVLIEKRPHGGTD